GFRLGPLAVARVARAPIVPVFALRTGIRQYVLRVVGRFDPTTPAESAAALEATVRAYEGLVREAPSQWLMFEDVWRDGGAAVPLEAGGTAVGSAPAPGRQAGARAAGGRAGARGEHRARAHPLR